MTNKLYVGNLPYRLKEEELQKMFAQAGNVVSLRIITDVRSGRSKGFAFVEMENEAQALEAIEKFNGAEIMGRALRVASARPPREKRSNRGRRF